MTPNIPQAATGSKVEIKTTIEEMYFNPHSKFYAWEKPEEDKKKK